MLSLHAGDDCGVHTSAFVKQWPEQFVLAMVMVRQTGFVPGQMPSEDSCPLGVAVGHRRNELTEQARLSTKRAMDNDHPMGVVSLSPKPRRRSLHTPLYAVTAGSVITLQELTPPSSYLSLSTLLDDWSNRFFDYS